MILKTLVLERSEWSYNNLAQDVHMSASEVHAAVKRLRAAQLSTFDDEQISVHSSRLLRFIEHGIACSFYAERGESTIGIRK